jgi:hypothetical protein
MSIRNCQYDRIVTQNLVYYYEALNNIGATLSTLNSYTQSQIPTYNTEFTDYKFYRVEGNPTLIYDNPKSSHVYFQNTSYYLKTSGGTASILQSYFGRDITIQMTLIFEKAMNYSGIYGFHNSGLLAQYENDGVHIGYYPITGGGNYVTIPMSIFGATPSFNKVNLTHTIENGTYNKVYINGLLYNSSTFSTPLTVFASNVFVLGKSYNQSNRFLQGNIYNISIYNRALNAQEILQNYYYAAGRYII